MSKFSACIVLCHRCRRLEGGTCTADPDRRTVSALAAAGTCPLGLFASVLMGAPAEVPADFDPAAEAVNLRRGSCCSPPAPDAPPGP